MIKIPNNLAQAFLKIDEILINEKMLDLLNEDENTFVARLHNNLGRWIRNNWGLWAGNGGLYNVLVKLGLNHADDMSGLILTSYYRNKKGISLKIPDEIKKYQAYWEKLAAERAPLPPDILAEALQDRVHITSGQLLSTSPIQTSKETIEEKETLKKLEKICKDFINNQNISCEESVFQNDNVALHALELIADICDVLGYAET